MPAVVCHTGDTGTVSLHQLERPLALFYRALCARSCTFLSFDDDAEQWQRPDTATTMRLPSYMHGGTADAGDWYRVAVAHRAMHYECGTFDFEMGRCEPFFRRLRPDPALCVRDGRTSLEDFFTRFSRPVLAVEVFTALEDLRIDTAAHRMLPGLAPIYTQVQAEALAARPEPGQLPPRSAIAEVLVQISLGARVVQIAESLGDLVGVVASIAAPLTHPNARVETSAEATVRVFSVLAGLPNLGSASGKIVAVETSAEPRRQESATFALCSSEVRLEGDEVFDVRFAPVRYRDVPGPRYLGHAASGLPLREAVFRMTTQAGDRVSEEDLNSQRSQAAESGSLDADEPTRPAPPPEPLPHDHGPDLDESHHSDDDPVHSASRAEFAYPEWDAVAGSYLPRWCLVRESRPESGRDDRAYREALRRYRHLLPAITSRLEQVTLAGRRRASRMPYGDDVDLDACLEAMVDLRTGVAPSERVHLAVVRDNREVAVAFALDLSSSTAERLPDDEARPREVRRIFDLEREAVVLLTTALGRVGDAYGVYGFSGTGRHDVEVKVVKGLDERVGPVVARRFDGLRPLHTTRMGPVIRHLTARLRSQEAPTKLLFMVSDGRPFDLDYGQRYGEDAVFDYALADTARALAEARAVGVQPYLITVDAAGEDYLRTICDEHEYQVIKDARQLPVSLAMLYLAARSRGSRRARSGRDDKNGGGQGADAEP
jgi:hypothetical protein